MKQSIANTNRLARLTAALAGIVVFALGASVSPAHAGDFTLRVSAPSTVFVGKPTIIRVSGRTPLQYTRFLYWLNVVSIRASVMAHCPASSWDASQIANATGGAILVLATREVPDANGNFTVPVGIRPYASGRARICAYTNDGEATTLAVASRVLTVRRR